MLVRREMRRSRERRAMGRGNKGSCIVVNELMNEWGVLCMRGVLGGGFGGLDGWF